MLQRISEICKIPPGVGSHLFIQSKRPYLHPTIMFCVLILASGGREWPRVDGDVRKFAEARIDLRKLAQFFNAQQFTPSQVVCSEFKQDGCTPKAYAMP